MEPAGREGATLLSAGRDGADSHTGACGCEDAAGGGGGLGRVTGAGGGGGLGARGAGGGFVARLTGAREADGPDERAGADDREEVFRAGAGVGAAARDRFARRSRRGARRRDSERAGFFLAAGFAGARSAVSAGFGGSGRVPKRPIDGAPSEPPTDSVCDRPTTTSSATQPPTASVVAALAPNSWVRALRATRRWRRPARTRTSSGSHAGGGWNSGSEAVLGSGSAIHFSNSASSRDTAGAGVTPRAPGSPGRRDGVTDGDSDGASGAGAGFDFGGADAARGTVRSTSATLTGAGAGACACASAGASAFSPSRSTRRMIRRGGQTPVRRDSSSSSLMFTIDRPVRLPAAKP